MKLLLYIIGCAFFALLDLSVGAFVIHIVGLASGEFFNAYQYLIGSFLAVLPDIDVIYLVFMAAKGTRVNHHELITHRPILVIPICVLVCWAIGGKIWGLIGGVCVLWHYLHDTEDLLGGGIALFWPLSSKYHSIRRIITPEQSTMNITHNVALETTTLRPSKKAFIETSVSTILLSVVVGGTINYAAAAAIAGFIWISLISVWNMFGKMKQI